MALSQLNTFIESHCWSHVGEWPVTMQDEEAAVAAILADPALVREAIVHIVQRLASARASVPWRRRQTTRRVASGEQLIEYGMRLLDVYVGDKRVGDYLPRELAFQADQLRTRGHVTLIQASFLKSLACSCPDQHVTVRGQVSRAGMRRIEVSLLERAPDGVRLLIAGMIRKRLEHQEAIKEGLARAKTLNHQLGRKRTYARSGALFLEGETLRAAAKRLGVSKATICRWNRQRGDAHEQGAGSE